MKTLLVILALKILAPELENLSVVKPKEAHDDKIEAPGDNDLGPNCRSIYSEGSDVDHPVGCFITLIVQPPSIVDWE